MPNRENTEIIPEDSVKYLYKCLYEHDPSMAQEYKDGLATGEINTKNHIDWSRIDKEWLKNQINEKRAVQSAMQGVQEKLNRVLGIMEKKAPKHLLNFKNSSVDFINKKVKIQYDGEIGGRREQRDENR
jgi:RNA polymerase-interacting CarD/CdnL/TRCF family regulator